MILNETYKEKNYPPDHMITIHFKDNFKWVNSFAIHNPEYSAKGMGQFPICKLKWDLLRYSITACTIDKNTFSAPFGIFNVRTEI